MNDIITMEEQEELLMNELKAISKELLNSYTENDKLEKRIDRDNFIIDYNNFIKKKMHIGTITISVLGLIALIISKLVILDTQMVFIAGAIELLLTFACVGIANKLGETQFKNLYGSISIQDVKKDIEKCSNRKKELFLNIRKKLEEREIIQKDLTKVTSSKEKLINLYMNYAYLEDELFDDKEGDNIIQYKKSMRK